jgi:hypothetical protein
MDLQPIRTRSWTNGEKGLTKSSKEDRGQEKMSVHKRLFKITDAGQVEVEVVRDFHFSGEADELSSEIHSHMGKLRHAAHDLNEISRRLEGLLDISACARSWHTRPG